MAKDTIETATAETSSGKPEWAMSRRERRAADRARQGLAPRRRVWPWIVLAILVLAAAGAWAFRDRLTALAPAPEEEAVAQPEAPRLTQINADEWTRLEPVTLRRTVKVIGTLQPSRRVDLSAEAAGQVESVEVRPGDAVTEGQVLVQIDVERLGLDLNLARSTADATRSQLALAEQQLERQEALVERGVAAETTLGEVRTNADALRANLSAQEDQIAGAELSLDRATVRAPFDGVVASRAVEPGAVVGTGTALLTVVDLSRMEMQGAAPVSAGAVLAPGQEVDLEVDGIEGRSFIGTVARIAPVAEEGTRTITAYVDVENGDGTLLGGMFATGAIVVDEARDALALPRAALREEDGDHVLILDDGTLARRDVTVGAEWPGGLVQVEGLEPGAQVVTAELPDLGAGEPVELVDF